MPASQEIEIENASHDGPSKSAEERASVRARTAEGHDGRQQLDQLLIVPLDKARLHFLQLCTAAAHELQKRGHRDHCAEDLVSFACRCLQLRSREAATAAMDQLAKINDCPVISAVKDEDAAFDFEGLVKCRDFAQFAPATTHEPAWKGNVRAMLMKAEEVVAKIDGSHVEELRMLREGLV